MFAAVAAVVLAGAANSSEITIYNQGFGFVKETRTVQLSAGRQNVAVEDVAAMIEPASVAIQSLTDKSSIKVLEQNYQYDLISPLAILNKSVGQRVRFVRFLGSQKEVLEGTLLSSPTAIVGEPGGGSLQTYNGMVIRTDDGRIVLDPRGEVEVLQVPKGLISRPTLLWELDSARAGENKVEISYLTKGMNWNADYVLTLDDTGRADIKGWVTIDNQSGASFEDAKLKLLAGEINRPPPSDENMKAPAMISSKWKDRQFQEESLFEYHLYTLQRPATLRNRETKQISLMEGRDVPVQKKLIIDSMQDYGQYYPGEGEVGTGNLKPQVRLEFTNDAKSGLGVPLPKGNVKVYRRDKSGSVQMLGEDQIGHTPKNERLSLVVERSFDVVASRKRTSFQRIRARAVRETFEIEVRNRKETAETVHVLERHWGDWRVTSKNMDFQKVDATSMDFKVALKPNETKTVTYTVESRW